MGSEELFKEETSPENAVEEENDGGVEIEWLIYGNHCFIINRLFILLRLCDAINRFQKKKKKKNI